ncbi:MAG: glucose 1-dehydrogenase [Pirellulaceae bacterium]|nr:glucose 1-dehydrogenase [Pirellulaceae bacterium]
MNAFQLTGKRALVTGASKGIGVGLARGLAAAGAELVVNARNADELETTAARLREETGATIHCEPFDLSAADELDSFLGSVVERCGPIDILINNAGRTHRGAAHEMPLEKWREVLDLNLTTVFALSQAFAKHRMAAGGGGRIINVGSLMCSTTRPNNTPYAASKGGVLLLTKAMAVDWADHGIRVNAIGPGYIDTPLNKALVDDPEFSDWVTQRCPLGRWGTPDDLSGTVVFLASPASEFITGQIIYVDGGFLARF